MVQDQLRMLCSTDLNLVLSSQYVQSLRRALYLFPRSSNDLVKLGDPLVASILTLFGEPTIDPL